MDKGTRLKQLLGYEITELEKELMPFLELQDDIELTEKEKTYIIRQHMLARNMRDNLLRPIENNQKLTDDEKKVLTQNAQNIFDLIMKETYNTIIKNRK